MPKPSSPTTKAARKAVSRASGSRARYKGSMKALTIGKRKKKKK